MQKKIKFSHIYSKLLIGDSIVTKEAILLAVIPVQLEDLSLSFLKYDTDNFIYALPKKGNYLMLIFKKESVNTSNNLFTTLRRSTPEKEDYYRGAIGEKFTVLIGGALYC